MKLALTDHVKERAKDRFGWSEETTMEMFREVVEKKQHVIDAIDIGVEEPDSLGGVSITQGGIRWVISKKEDVILAVTVMISL